MGESVSRRKRSPNILPVAQLHLERFWVDSIRMQANTSDQVEPNSDIGSLEGVKNVLVNEDGNSYLVTLIVESLPLRDPRPYSFAISLAGTFSFAPGTDEHMRSILIEGNAPAILYGVARGAIASITGLGPHGPLFLPSVNFSASRKTRPRRRKLDEE